MKTTIHCFASVFVTLFFLFLGLSENFALSYTVSFSGSGASTTVGEVIVQNLTKGSTVTVPAGNVLNLYDVVSTVYPLSVNGQPLSVYPNPVQGKVTLSFFANQKGNCQIRVFSLDGKLLAGLTENLQTGGHSFRMFLPNGVFSIVVGGDGYSYIAKVISQASLERNAKIVFLGNDKRDVTAPYKAKSNVTQMLYSPGDQLLYKGISGNYSTIVADMPSGSKSVNFDFVECRDADGNDYPVLKIGEQTWMAENLKTTRYRTGDAIPNVINDTTWWSIITGAWCIYDNDPANVNKYGILYNWFAVDDSLDIAPVGWHVATDADWTKLENHLIANGFNYDVTTTDNKIAKSISTTSGWMICDTIEGAIGNDMTKNNKSGFSGLPAGSRACGGQYEYMGLYGYWWCSDEVNATQGRGRALSFQAGGLYGVDAGKLGGSTVRCVKD